MPFLIIILSEGRIKVRMEILVNLGYYWSLAIIAEKFPFDNQILCLWPLFHGFSALVFL
jgi:hypothetical protein